eukprot:8899657-Karenia_brevis.AAC.1
MGGGGVQSNGLIVHTEGPGQTDDTDLGSDCGFLVPRALEQYIKLERHRKYWSGMLLHNIVFLSAHFLELGAEDGKAAV